MTEAGGMPCFLAFSCEASRTGPRMNEMAALLLRGRDTGATRIHDVVQERVALPLPGAGDLLVRVGAARIGPTEWRRPTGSAPVIPGRGFSGVVVGVGVGVSDVAPGDDVYGLVPAGRAGAAAQYVAVPAACAAPKPQSLDHVAAASVPMAALTAWQALVDGVAVQAGDQLLVHGGAGAIGRFAIQLAFLAGARVTTTCRGRDTPTAFRLGAERVIDFETRDFASALGRWDAIVDTVGAAVLERSFGKLRAGGRIVTLPAEPPPRYLHEYGVRCAFLDVAADGSVLGEVTRLIDAGALRVATPSHVAFDCAGDGHGRWSLTEQALRAAVLRIGTFEDDASGVSLPHGADSAVG
jgi:NADPH:quinone reductase-like Zn-dependent oxidoreductase